MKKIALLLSAVLSPFLLWSKPLVFATPAEEFSKARAALFQTGLSCEELLPKLKSLFDGELLD